MSMHFLFWAMIFVFVVLPIACMWFAMHAPFGHEDENGFHEDKAPTSAADDSGIVQLEGACTPQESHQGHDKPCERGTASPDSRFEDAIKMELGSHEPFEVITASPPCEHFAKGSSKRLAGRQIVRHLSKLP